MLLTVLGSGTVAPSGRRTSPAHWVTTGEVRLLLDCGAGMLHRAASVGIPWQEATHVAVTHFHVDHWGELPALLFAMRYGIEPPRTEPLTLIGPTGFTQRLEHLAHALGDWVLDPGFDIEIEEIHPGQCVSLDSEVTLESYGTAHTEQSVAYGVRDSEVRLVYTGDTGPDAGLARWATGCDLLLAECSLPDERAIDIHLTPTRAGDMAAAARAGELVLTHLYPVFGAFDPVSGARERYAGKTSEAHDGDQFEIKKRKL